MIALEAPMIDTLPAAWDEALLQLELRVARRADALSRGTIPDPVLDRTIWSEAERIELGEVPVAASMPAYADAAA